jgi:hypothetical protein
MQETGGIVSLVRRRIIQRIVHCNRVRTVIFAMLALALNGVPAMAQTSYSQPKLQAAVRVLSADPTGTLRDPCDRVLEEMSKTKDLIDQGFTNMGGLLQNWGATAVTTCSAMAQSTCEMAYPPPQSPAGQRIAAACRIFQSAQ